MRKCEIVIESTAPLGKVFKTLKDIMELETEIKANTYKLVKKNNLEIVIKGFPKSIYIRVDDIKVLERR